VEASNQQKVVDRSEFFERIFLLQLPK